jgi:hypothetical protein
MSESHAGTGVAPRGEGASCAEAPLPVPATPAAPGLLGWLERCFARYSESTRGNWDSLAEEQARDPTID